MKALALATVLTLAMILGLSTFAFAGEATQYICKSGLGHTMMLKQVGDEKIVEGKKFAFVFLLFDGRSKEPVLAKRVFVQTEDVMFQFESRDQSVAGTIYLDEMDETWVTVEGKDLAFDCN